MEIESIVELEDTPCPDCGTIEETNFILKKGTMTIIQLCHSSECRNPYWDAPDEKRRIDYSPENRKNFH